MINFNSLPSDKPFTVPEPGTYYAHIDSAEMKQGKDLTKPPYLNLKYKLKNKEGKAAGTVFDILAESEHQLVQYKLKRFLLAIGAKFEGSFELSDLQKICGGKDIIVDIKVEKDNKGQDRAQVDLTSGQAYYNLSEATDVFGEAADVVDAINAPDGKDAEQTVPDEF